MKRSHWSGRVPLSTPHLVNAIVAEYHVVFFFFVEPSQAGSEMVLRDQRGRMIDVGIPAAAAQLVYIQCLFFPPDYLFAAPQSSVPHVDRVPMCI